MALCWLALLVEASAGYPTRLFEKVGHPVTWMGWLLSHLDGILNIEGDTYQRRRLAGTFALTILLCAAALVSSLAIVVVRALIPDPLAAVVIAILASSCLAQRSLHDHVRAVADALDQKGLAAGRAAVGAIVGRDTGRLDESGVCRAAIESLAENFADGVVAPAFWLVLLGLPGGIVYKAINTADSMIGHRTARHEAFGFAAAKLDDIVNWVPARLAGALLVAAATAIPNASSRAAWRIMLRDAGGHPSPNAGWPEAAMAGALDLRLGGPRTYAERAVHDAYIGDGKVRLDARDIRRALRVYRVACAIEFGSIVLLWIFTWLWR